MGREAYLSAFTFGADFRRHLETHRHDQRATPALAARRGSGGTSTAKATLNAATRDARRLAAALVERYRLDGDELLLFFSGSKGYHAGLPLSLVRLAAAVRDVQRHGSPLR